jgi:hypothetical protein
MGPQNFAKKTCQRGGAFFADGVRAELGEPPAGLASHQAGRSIFASRQAARFGDRDGGV